MSDPKEAPMFMSRDLELHSFIKLQKHAKNLTRVSQGKGDFTFYIYFCERVF